MSEDHIAWYNVKGWFFAVIHTDIHYLPKFRQISSPCIMWNVTKASLCTYMYIYIYCQLVHLHYLFSKNFSYETNIMFAEYISNQDDECESSYFCLCISMVTVKQLIIFVMISLIFVFILTLLFSIDFYRKKISCIWTNRCEYSWLATFQLYTILYTESNTNFTQDNFYFVPSNKSDGIINDQWQICISGTCIILCHELCHLGIVLIYQTIYM